MPRISKATNGGLSKTAIAARNEVALREGREGDIAPREGRTVQIPAPAMSTAIFTLWGTAPYMQNHFSKKSEDIMREKMEAGSQSKKGQKRTARNFEEDFKQAQYISREGWNGVPAHCFRLAMISACRLVGFKMTLAKLSLFVEADGHDQRDGTALVKIEGKPRMSVARTMLPLPRMDIRPVKNATGVMDLRARPIWDEWSIPELRVRFDTDQFSLTDVSHLLMRVGMQVGIGEGRPDSKESAGMGFGLFSVETEPKAKAKAH